MLRDEYLSLVKNSPIFQGMQPNLQKKILDATEAMMPKYLEILQEGDQTLNLAQNEFLEKSKVIVKTFSTEVKKLKVVKLKRDETKARNEDEKIGLQLLESLKNL